MVVGEVAETTEVLVIGAGPGGYAAAIEAAHLGRQVTLVERGRIGGVCLNVGCIPSKALIHAADLASGPADAASWGVDLSATVDMSAVHHRIGEVVSTLTGGVERLLHAAGVRVEQGTARFARRRKVVIDGGDEVKHFEFDHCIIATGSRPLELPALPFDGSRVLDSTGVLALESVPASLAVVGGGYIGMELGTALAKLGSQVTVVEMADSILPGIDPRLTRVVARRLRGLGITVLTGARATGLTDDSLVVAAAQGEIAVPATKVLVAAGRVPNTDDLGLEVAGIELTPSGHIEVGPDRRATPDILAIGNITAGPALAHKATAEAEVAARTVSGLVAAFDPAAIPLVVFSDPEVASVGATLDRARSEDPAATEYRFPYTAGSRSHTMGHTEGFVQMVADSAGTVVGVHMVGAGVSELAGEAALAVEMGATLEDLAATIHPHPTMSEGLVEAAKAASGHPLHVLPRR